VKWTSTWLHAPEGSKHDVVHFREHNAEVDVWVCAVMLAICLVVMAFTAEWLVHSVNFVRREVNIEEESAFLLSLKTEELQALQFFPADGSASFCYL
jgi:Ca2+/H+ antiporter